MVTGFPAIAIAPFQILFALLRQRSSWRLKRIQESIIAENSASALEAAQVHSNSKQDSAPEPPRLPPNWSRLLKVLIAIGLIITALIFAASIFFRIYTGVQSNRLHEQRTIVERATAFQEQGQYQNCLDQFSGWQPSSNSALENQKQFLQNTCQEKVDEANLRTAQMLASNGRYRDAIALAQSISSSALQSQIKILIQHCSERIIQIAQDYYDAGKLDESIFVVSAITSNNQPYYEQAQSKIQRFKADWAENMRHYDTAIAALNANQVNIATTEAQQVTHPYWVEKIKPLQEKLDKRREELTLLESGRTIGKLVLQVVLALVVLLVVLKGLF